MGNHGSNLDDILAEDMHHWYNKFMRESPSGLITLFELKAILNLKGITENANSYVEQVFFTFDMDGVGSTQTHTALLSECICYREVPQSFVSLRRGMFSEV
ncbi:hypothetical protein ILYODFUR_031847 [Ilyodon furcidens]|uniref:Guanylate cyclase activator 1d n=1 Tax=Ilyodon furcidens TaxID=33524 RepID=A0ABV0TR30_9TELE